MADQSKPKITIKLKGDLLKSKKDEKVDIDPPGFFPTTSNSRDKDISDTEINICGTVDGDNKYQFCINCELPIILYARLMPCKHCVCAKCADQLVINPYTKCRYCNSIISGNEKVPHSQLFSCDYPDKKLNKPCGKSYLSQRDLSAHISHRHTENN